MADLTTVAGRIRWLRERKGYGSRELGTLAGLSSAAVSNIENEHAAGDNVRIGTIRALATVLGCEPAWLAFGTGPSPDA